MTNIGTILIADDDETFLASTAELLRARAYEVQTAMDADSAMAAVCEGDFDLLISDLEMPGNEDLRLTRDVAASVGGLPVIILTGLPTTASAVACIDLPVAGYLLKPVDIDELLRRVEVAIGRFRTYRAMREAEARMERMREDLGRISMADPAQSRASAPSVDAFLALTLRNVMGSLTDLGQLGHALRGEHVQSNPCQLMNCPRGAQLQSAIAETIDVLEQTKASFKSKQLGELRHRLALLLEHV